MPGKVAPMNLTAPYSTGDVPGKEPTSLPTLAPDIKKSAPGPLVVATGPLVVATKTMGKSPLNKTIPSGESAMEATRRASEFVIRAVDSADMTKCSKESKQVPIEIVTNTPLQNHPAGLSKSPTQEKSASSDAQNFAKSLSPSLSVFKRSVDKIDEGAKRQGLLESQKVPFSITTVATPLDDSSENKTQEIRNQENQQHTSDEKVAKETPVVNLFHRRNRPLAQLLSQYSAHLPVFAAHMRADGSVESQTQWSKWEDDMLAWASYEVGGNSEIDGAQWVDISTIYFGGKRFPAECRLRWLQKIECGRSNCTNRHTRVMYDSFLERMIKVLGSRFTDAQRAHYTSLKSVQKPVRQRVLHTDIPSASRTASKRSPVHKQLRAPTSNAEKANAKRERKRKRESSHEGPSQNRKQPPWSREERTIVKEAYAKLGNDWEKIAELLPGRNAHTVQCAWYNIKRNTIKQKGATWSEDERRILIEGHAKMGRNWEGIAALLPGRTAHTVRCTWQNIQKKNKGTKQRKDPKLSKETKQTKETMHVKKSSTDATPWTGTRINETLTPWTKEERRILVEGQAKLGSQWQEIAEFLPGRSAHSVQYAWNNMQMRPGSKPLLWTEEEKRIVMETQEKVGKNWEEIAALLPGRSANTVRCTWYHIKAKEKKDKTAKAKKQTQDVIKSEAVVDTSLSKETSTCASKFWTEEEKRIMMETQEKVGKNWKEIAALLPGRNARAVMCAWYHIKAKEKKDETAKEKKQTQDAIKTKAVVDTSLSKETSTRASKFWTEDEKRIVMETQEKVGKNWEEIAALLPGRNAHTVMCTWYHIKAKEKQMGKSGKTAKAMKETQDVIKSKAVVNISPGEKTSNMPWSEEEGRIVVEKCAQIGNEWQKIADLLPGRSAHAVKCYWYRYNSKSKPVSVPSQDKESRQRNTISLKSTPQKSPKNFIAKKRSEVGKAVFVSRRRKRNT